MVNELRTVLILVTDSAQRERLGHYVQQNPSYTVVTAATATKGLEQGAIARPDVMLVDERLPEMSGLECWQALQSDGTVLPVVFIVSSSEQVQRPDRQYAQQYLHKATLTAETVHLAIDGVIAEAALLRQITTLQIQGSSVNREDDQDATEPFDRQQIEDQVHQLSNRLELAIASGQIGIWEWDIINDRLEWDDRMYELYGIEASDFLGAYQAWEFGVHPDDRAMANRAIQQAIRGEKDYNPEFRVVHPDGAIRTIKASAMVQRNAQGEALRMIGVNYDISDQQRLLQEHQQAQAVLEQQFEQKRLLMEMIQRIRRSLNLQDILQTTVDEVRHYLNTDRVVIFQFSPNWNGRIIVESVGDHWLSLLSTEIHDPCVGEGYVEPFKQGLVTVKSDIDVSDISDCHRELLLRFQVRANLVVPILRGEELWGLLVAHHCSAPRPWSSAEIDLLRQISSQLSIAIQQSILFEQSQTELLQRKQTELALQQLNIELEQRVDERTIELAQVNDRLLETLVDQQHTQMVLQEQAQLLDLAHDTILTHDLSDVITFWNEGAELMYGWAKAEAMGQAVHTILHTQFPQLLTDIKAELLQNGYWEGELQQTCRDGSIIIVDSRWVMQKDALGKPIKILQINNNITARKQAEAVIRQQSERESLLLEISQRIRQSLDLTTIFETASEEIRQFIHADRVGIFKFYPESSFDDGEFVAESVVDGFDSVLAIRIHDHCFGEQYAIHYQQGRIQAVDDVYQAGLLDCHRDVLTQFQIRANLVVPLLNGENLWGLLCIHQCSEARHWHEFEIDLVQQIANQLAIAIYQSQLYEQLRLELQERKQAEAVSREAERRWRSLFESTNLAVVSSDHRGIIQAANPFFLQLTGYTEQELVGQSWFDRFVSIEQRQDLLQQFQEKLRQEYYPSVQGVVPTKSGEEKVINWSNTLLRNPTGEVIGVTSIGEDVTQRQAVEKLKDEFVGIVSHELRTPLTSIRGSLGLLATGVMDGEPDEMRRMIEIASIDTERLVRLVNDMLDLEKLETDRVSLVREWCDAADLMQRSLEVMESSAQEAGVQLVIESLSTQIWVAPDRIIQTLTNLISNAIKFSSSGSTVWIRANVREGIASPSADPRSPTSHILFSITDQGRGIPADKLATIFGRFQQVDASDSRDRGGTGLGLAICQSIVHQHGGQIWAESVWGQGSTFFFTLPLLTALGAPPPTPNASINPR